MTYIMIFGYITCFEFNSLFGNMLYITLYTSHLILFNEGSLTCPNLPNVAQALPLPWPPWLALATGPLFFTPVQMWAPVSTWSNQKLSSFGAAALTSPVHWVSSSWWFLVLLFQEVYPSPSGAAVWSTPVVLCKSVGSMNTKPSCFHWLNPGGHMPLAS